MGPKGPTKVFAQQKFLHSKGNHLQNEKTTNGKEESAHQQTIGLRISGICI